jgi:hypothetical protein
MGATLDNPKDFVDKRVMFAGRSLSVQEVENLLEETIRARDEQIVALLDAVLSAHPLFDGSTLAREVRAIASALRGAK